MEKKKRRPQDVWNEKAGYVSKSYKLKQDVVDDFKEACDRAGVSQASQITTMMKEFIIHQKK